MFVRFTIEILKLKIKIKKRKKEININLDEERVGSEIQEENRVCERDSERVCLIVKNI